MNEMVRRARDIWASDDLEIDDHATRAIDTKTLQSFIRNGGWAWPGGYPMALLMGDGEVIDAKAARENYRLIREAMKDEAITADWYPLNAFIHWEGEPLICAHSGREIPSAYGLDLTQ